MHVPEPVIIASIVLLVGSIAASFVDRLGAPTLLLFLAVGVFLGEDGPVGIHFDNAELARDVGLLALALILLEGGVLADLGDVRSAAKPAGLLATGGVLVTAAVTGIVARVTLGVGWFGGLLVGATVASTDAAAVFSAIRGLNVRRRLAAVLEAESGLNDPFAALLVIGLVDWRTSPGYGITDEVLLLVEQVAVGAVGGVAVGIATVWLLRRLPLLSAGIAPVVTISAVLAGYVAVSVLHGSGLLAVYLAGLIIGDARIPHAGVVRGFLQGGAWLAQLTLFVLLGLLVTPSHLVREGFAPLLIALGLVLIARPLAVAVCTPWFGLDRREGAFLAWAGLRGGVPIVFATFPIVAGVHGSVRIFDVVFYVVVVSVLLQGLTVRWAAMRLGVVDTRPSLRMADLDSATLESLGADVLELRPSDLGIAPGEVLGRVSFPGRGIVVAIERGEEVVLPRGSTTIDADDRLYLLVKRERLAEVQHEIQRIAAAGAA